MRQSPETKGQRMSKPGKAGFGDAQVYAMLEAIRKRSERDPGWRVIARGKDWLCPYCGEVGYAGYEESKAPREILRHLLNDCPHWSEESGTRFGHKLLQEKARHIETEELLRTSRAWRAADKVGHWYCPHCAQATNVPWKADSKDASPPAELVHAHLEKCPASRDGRKPHSLEVLNLVIQDADRYRELTVAVRCRMEVDASWRQVTREGKWLCPRCRQVVPEVDLTSDSERVALAPVRIARHLMERCKQRAAGAAAAPAAPASAPAALPGQSPPTGEMLTLPSTSIHRVAQQPPAPAPVPEPVPAAAPAPAAPQVAREALPNLGQEDVRERLSRELPTSPPMLDGYDVHCLYVPVRNVGGTFYDYFYLSPENFAIVVCGLPSRGLDAVQTVADFRRSLRRHSRHHRSPAEVLRRTNEDVTTEHGSRVFLTALYGILDAHTGYLTYARAGHSMPILFNPQDDPAVRELRSKGVAIGIQKGAGFDQAIDDVAVRFRPGDTLLLYAGGVTEAENIHGEPYGLARLASAIVAPHGDPSSQALATRIIEDIQQFLTGAPQRDDVTILCLRKP